MDGQLPDSSFRRRNYAISSILNPQPPPTRTNPSHRPTFATHADRSAPSGAVEIVDLTGSSPDSPPTTNARPTSSTNTSDETRKRRRDSQDGAPARQRQRIELDPTPVISLTDTEESSSDDDEEEVDAAEKLRQEEFLKSQRESSARTKLSDFKCAVCLDDPTDLVTTPCGHLFCDKCVRMALRAGQPENAKSGHCPICRSKVVLTKLTVLEIKLGSRRNKNQEKGKEAVSV